MKFTPLLMLAAVAMPAAAQAPTEDESILHA